LGQILAQGLSNISTGSSAEARDLLDVTLRLQSLPSEYMSDIAAVEGCDVLLFVGTSGVVYPVAGFPAIARRQRARVVEINLEPTPLSELAHLVLRGAAGALLPALEAAL